MAWVGCNYNSPTTHDFKSDTVAPVISETVVSDSLLLFEDSLYRKLDLELNEITELEYKRFEKIYKLNCSVDTGGFISGYGLSVKSACDEICETYLIESKSRNKILLPSSYDGGIAGLTFSPSCNQFIVFSSYDGPDYVEYYSDRAEIFGFKVTTDKGLKAVKPAFIYFSKDWSLENLVWINDSTIALKTYAENRSAKNQDHLHYMFFKADLSKGNLRQN